MTMEDTFNPDILDHPLFQRQIDLEEQMRSAGVQRYREKVRKALDKGKATDTKPGNRLVAASHEKMVEAIKAFIAEAESGKAGRRHTAVKYVKKLDVDTVANIAIRCFIDMSMMEPTVTKAAVSVGILLENEVNARKFAEEMPNAYKKFHEKAKQETLQRRQWSHLLMPGKLLGVELELWPEKDRLLVGLKLLEMFIDATGLVETCLMQSKAKDKTFLLRGTDDTLAWMEEENRRLEFLFPVYMPTIIPPKPWTTPFDGGYYTQHGRSMTLVKTFNRQYLKELAERDMPEVYAGINALQNTRWAVNKPVLEVMQRVYDAGTKLADLPSAEKEAFPAPLPWFPAEGKVKREDMTPEQVEEFKAWKAEMHRTYVYNSKSIRTRQQCLRTLSVAHKFKDEEAIYFPHQLDWRGRAYPLPLYLHPQGSDMQRSLLTFADAAPITTKEQADWLAIHGAGCFGFDKASMEDRVQWVIDHERDILASAADPFDNKFWLEADKPWCFLAFCYEWSGFVREGYGFMSSLPIQMDGTCNGLQNFSAMLLDEVGGAAVNLVPADKPQDIYQRVADIVAMRVEQDLDSDDEEVRFLARGWSGNVTRKVCKRPVMTLAYGAKRFGFVSQVEEDTLKDWRVSDPWGYPFIADVEGKSMDLGYKAAMYMGKLIWESVGEVVIAARSAMDWLQAAASAVSKENLPIHWTTPTGLLVQQSYRVLNLKRVITAFHSQRVDLSYMVGEGKIDSRRQSSGISPNWVHSLDAAHLMRTVNRASAEGIAHFSMIHDSYGTHAANAPALAEFLREEFVQMYSEVDVLARFKSELEAQTSNPIPDLPAKGSLDLEQVKQSQFFFA